jgi:hypothetical protein
MKKRAAALALALFFLLSFAAGCGAATKSAESGAADMAGEAPAPAEAQKAQEGLNYQYSSAASASDVAAGGGEGPSPAGGQLDPEKIIWTADAWIETRSFDESIQAVKAMLDQYGGFIQSSAITGANYYAGGKSGGRSAEFTLRIPRENFNAVNENGVYTLGNVTYRASDSENITPQYTDTESRLKSYRIQEERLLAMLEKAETVEDMLNIEDRLANVRYNIESLTSTIQGWDSLINYSTITLRITEVADFTEETDVTRTYWQQVSDALKTTLKSLGGFFKWLLKFLIAALPVLIVLAVIAVPVVILIRRARKNRKSRPAPPAPPRNMNNGRGE